MASGKNAITDGLSGGIAKQLVFKQYAKGTVITRYPDMSNVKPSKAQKFRRNRFAEAVRYAQGILADDKKKAAYQSKIGKGKSVYHAAIKEYMKSLSG
jgi:hypothetical protein